jgi:uncharacterized protein YgiM (DUF1202 family)
MAALMLIAAAPVAMADPEITEDSILTIVNVKHSANVREQATSDSKKLGEAKKGKTFKLLDVDGDWYKIQYTTSKVGYVFHEYGKVGKKGDSSLSGTGTVVKESGRVNIRSKPSTKGDILGTAVNGETFEVKGKSGHWYKIVYKGDTAYIHQKYFKVGGGGGETPPSPPVLPGEKGYVSKCKTSVNVRAAATSKSKKLGELKRGTEVNVTGISGKWTQISYKGDVAYVFSTYVSSTKPDSDIVGKTATIVNCKSWVNVRAKASSNSKKLGTADKGSTWTIEGRSGNWIQVDYSGTSAFIHKRYVKIG